jgi:hypothetical protein
MTHPRKQLELAAKVAGVTHIEYTNGYDGKYGLQLCDEIGRHTRSWNPTTSKSDCLDLMIVLVALGAHFAISFERAQACIGCYSGIAYLKDHNSDKGEALMAAVFLCAVEIGRDM